MDAAGEIRVRAAALLSERIDPIARDVLAARDPRDAHEAAGRVGAVLSDELDWLPHAGGIHVAWAELEDLYETGKTPTPDAHAALRQAATDWLSRSGPPDASCVERWLAATAQAVQALVDRDGDFWRSPE